MGMTPQNSIATMVASKPHALWDVPAHWTLAQVTLLPLAPLLYQHVQHQAICGPVLQPRGSVYGGSCLL